MSCFSLRRAKKYLILICALFLLAGGVVQADYLA